MPVHFHRWVLGVAAVLLLAGCVPERLKTSESRLKETLRLYDATVRWGALERTYSFLQPDLAAAAEIPETLGNVRVTGYETVAGPSPLSETRWAHSVSITYVLQDQQVVKTLLDNQVWERDEESGAWLRANPVPPLR